MAIFDLLNNLVSTNWKPNKNWFIHEFKKKNKVNSWSKCFIIQITFKCLLSIEYCLMVYNSGVLKKMIFHWSCSNNISLCMPWWSIKLLLDAKYLPPKSHYKASHQVCSMKTLHHTGHIYMASPQCVFSDDLQKQL